MAGWRELYQHITTNYEVVEAGDRWCIVRLHRANGRHQAVSIRHAQQPDTGEQLAFLESPIGLLGEVDLERALIIASENVCGGLGLFNSGSARWVAVQHTVFLDNLDLNEFDRPLGAIALSADEVEEALLGTDTT